MFKLIGINQLNQCLSVLLFDLFIIIKKSNELDFGFITSKGWKWGKNRLDLWILSNG